MSIVLDKKYDVYIAPYIGPGKDARGNTINLYGEPFRIESEAIAVSGSSDIKLYGDRAQKMCRSTPYMRDCFGRVHEGDKAYLFGATPEGESTPGANANDKVASIRPQKIKLQIYFEELPRKREVTL